MSIFAKDLNDAVLFASLSFLFIASDIELTTTSLRTWRQYTLNLIPTQTTSTVLARVTGVMLWSQKRSARTGS